MLRGILQNTHHSIMEYGFLESPVSLHIMTYHRYSPQTYFDNIHTSEVACARHEFHWLFSQSFRSSFFHCHVAIAVKSELYITSPTRLANLNYLHCVHNAIMCKRIYLFSWIRWYINRYHLVDILYIFHCWKASIKYSRQWNFNTVWSFRRILRDNTIRLLLYLYI